MLPGQGYCILRMISKCGAMAEWWFARKTEGTHTDCSIVTQLIGMKRRICGDRRSSDHLRYSVAMNICALIRRNNSVTLSLPCAGQEGVLLKIRWRWTASHPSYPTPGKKSAWYRLNTGWFGLKAGLDILDKKEVSQPWWYSKTAPSSSSVPRGGLGDSNPSPWNSEGPPKSCQTQPDCEKC